MQRLLQISRRCSRSEIMRKETAFLRGSTEQRREYYWWDSHDSIDDFRAKLIFILRSEGIENPENTADRLMKSRRVHSLKDLIQHSLASLKYYVKPASAAPKLYRRVQREVGNEVSAGAAQGANRDEAAEPDEGRLSSIGVTMHRKGIVDPRILRYQGPKLGNFKRYQDPELY
eukprot:TRINITY_DN31355_c0_g1_i1.p1 TRINITY_DN31355_c0_g1~~TRINITY_DN31355_c0_g1_i1.p1  ORF type:complete len:173 (+),score=16.62 TRINITY_DN31355_c0_g1_i1:33-551(+)